MLLDTLHAVARNLSMISVVVAGHFVAVPWDEPVDD